MWLLINVDDAINVGKNENERYWLSDNLSIVIEPGSDVVTIMSLGTKVHPATKSDIIDEIWCDDDDTL